MMTTRSTSKPAAGELSTFAAFKDKALLGLIALAIAVMWFFVSANQKQVDSFHADITGVRSEIAELRTRLTADQNASTEKSSRLGTQNEEALRRLAAIDQKIEALTARR